MIGVCKLLLGDSKGAISAFKTAANSDRISAQQTVAVQYELANAYEVSGDHTAAKSLFEKVSKLDPKFRDAATRAKAPTKANVPENGEQEFDLASELAPDSSGAPPSEEPPKKGKISYV